MLEGIGKLIFDPNDVTNKHIKQSGWKKTAILFLNDDTEDLYRYFVRRRYNIDLNKTLRGSHITIINDKFNDDNKWNMVKEKYNKMELSFQYNPADVRTDGAHWWIKVQSNDALFIRNELGLGTPYFGLHLTLGYVPDVPHRLEHSNYIHRIIQRFE